MRRWLAEKGATMADLKMVDVPQPVPGPGEVLIRVRACSLNYRDHGLMPGAGMSGVLEQETTPVSDGAGEIAALGDGVTGFALGDRVAGIFLMDWIDGPLTAGAGLTLGGPGPGMLSDYVVLPAHSVVRLAPSLSFEEAACLPCAGVTAWNALMEGPSPLKAGQSVLVIGTGGVSILALQIARAAGARVIATSSSDEKLERLRAMGAEAVINYRTNPDWGAEASRLAGGIDHVVEVGGAATLPQSLAAVTFCGEIAVVGVLAGIGAAPPQALIRKQASMRGIWVGSRRMAESLNTFVETHALKPVISRVFPMEEARAAFAHQRSPDLFGKVVISLG